MTKNNFNVNANFNAKNDQRYTIFNGSAAVVVFTLTFTIGVKR